jgi:hypothetical protein
MRSAVLLLVLTAASVALAESDPPDAFHGGVSFGAGTAYDGLGLRVEGGSNHFGLFGGFGLLPAMTWDTTTASRGFGFSAGLRWYHRVRAGLFVSLNITYAWWRKFSNYDLRFANSPTNPGRLFTATAVGGYRWRSETGGFFEIGVGGGMFRQLEPYTCTNVGIDCSSVANAPTRNSGVIPDIVLGGGIDL